MADQDHKCEKTMEQRSEIKSLISGNNGNQLGGDSLLKTSLREQIILERSTMERYFKKTMKLKCRDIIIV